MRIFHSPNFSSLCFFFLDVTTYIYKGSYATPLRFSCRQIYMRQKKLSWTATGTQTQSTEFIDGAEVRTIYQIPIILVLSNRKEQYNNSIHCIAHTYKYGSMFAIQINQFWVSFLICIYSRNTSSFIRYVLNKKIGNELYHVHTLPPPLTIHFSISSFIIYGQLYRRDSTPVCTRCCMHGIISIEMKSRRKRK